jgi:hypothetical protein
VRQRLNLFHSDYLWEPPRRLDHGHLLRRAADVVLALGSIAVDADVEDEVKVSRDSLWTQRGVLDVCDSVIF